MTRFAKSLAGSASAVLLLFAGWSLRGDGRAAAAQEAVETPVFSTPLEITNEFAPFVPGAVTVYAGTERGVPTLRVVTHSKETRDFVWNGAVVSCRIVDELQFRRGVASGHELTFLAQSDDGAVWAFGDVEDSDPTDDGGDDKSDPGGWIVGHRAATDPATMIVGAAPAVFMPARPSVGDAWTSEASPPTFVMRSSVLAANDTVRGAGGRQRGCLRVRRVDVPQKTALTMWFAPGAGLVQTRGEGERMNLRASTIGRGR